MTRAWLAEAFGFRERANARLSGTLEGKDWVLAWMEVGDGLINLATAGGHDLHSPTTVSGSSQGLKVYVDDVDGHFDRAKAAGALIESEPVDGFWGGRIYRALDSENHHWEFSQAGVDLAAADWRLPPGVTRGVG